MGQKVYRTIDFLRFPMAVAVVILHHSVTLIVGSKGALHGLCILFQEELCRLAVPCFFLVSGYLFFSRLEKWNWDVWKGKIKSRLGSLLLPYLIWNVIAFLVYWGYAAMFGEPAAFADQWAKYGGPKMFWSVEGGIPLGVKAYPIDGPLWFIRDLMVYTLLTPAVYLFLKLARYWGLAAVVLVHLLVQGLVPEGFVFFLAGACLMMEGQDIEKFFRPARKWLYASFLVLLALVFLLNDRSLYWTRFFKVFLLFTGIGSAFCLSGSLLESGKAKVRPFLVRSSFFIFALHDIVLPREYATRMLSAVYPFSGTAWKCIEFFLTPALTVCLCLGILYLLEHLLPGLAGLLTGNRQKRKVQI